MRASAWLLVPIALGCSAPSGSATSTGTSTSGVASTTSGTSTGTETTSGGGTGTSSAGSSSTGSSGATTAAGTTGSTTSTCATCNAETGLCAPLAACSSAAPCDDNGQTITKPAGMPTCSPYPDAGRGSYDDGPPFGFTDPQTGDARLACLYWPSGGGPHPLVLFFHGSTASADMVYDQTSLRAKAPIAALSGDAGTPGFVLASVQGRNTHWSNPTNEGAHFDIWYRDASSPSTNPDVSAVDALVDALVSDGGVDPARIYTTGWSNGAFFAQMYAIDRFATATPGGNRVAATVVYAGGDPFNNLSDTQSPSCQLATYPSSTVPLMLVHRDCDAQVGCDGAQQMAFSLPPGMDVDDWFTALGSKVGDGTVQELLLSGAGQTVSMCDTAASCSLSTGNDNHHHWPDGIADGSGMDWEPNMLAFLKQHALH